MNLSDRIDAAFQTHTGSDKTRGARTWFARVLRVSNRTVTRWCDGSQPFDGPALSALEMLELLAGVLRGYERLARPFASDNVGDQWERDLATMRADELRIRAP